MLQMEGKTDLVVEKVVKGLHLDSKFSLEDCRTLLVQKKQIMATGRSRNDIQALARDSSELLRMGSGGSQKEI